MTHTGFTPPTGANGGMSDDGHASIPQLRDRSYLLYAVAVAVVVLLVFHFKKG